MPEATLVAKSKKQQPSRSETQWYNPGASITAFHASKKFVRFLVGARGSGKTSAACLEAIGHCWHNAGAKVLFVRKTEVSQSDTTVETLARCFIELGALYTDTGESLFKEWNNGRTFRLPSAEAVERFNEIKPTCRSKAEINTWLDGEGSKYCSFIEMRGLPHALVAENKLRGFECSMMNLIEADLLDQRDFAMAMPCLRWKGLDGEFIESGGIIVETNPPSPRHWIAKLEEETKKDEHPDYEFWHIKTQENAHNLPPNYVENLKEAYRNNPAMYARMVEGDYAEAFDGNPVMHAFKAHFHAEEHLPWPRGAHLVRGWDFGTHNAVVWSAYFLRGGCEYWWDLAEQYLEGSDTDRQCREAMRLTDSEFPFWNDRDSCAGVIDYCDPAGASSNFGISINSVGQKIGSCVQILNTYGIYPSYKLWSRSIQMTIAIYNRLMEKQDAQGDYCYRIDKLGCPILYRAHLGEYRYPAVGEPGYGNDLPLKGTLCGNVDHLEDASRYPKIGALRLLRTEFEQPKPSNLPRPKNPNPNRRKW